MSEEIELEKLEVLSSLNNKLNELHRQLARKNAELERLNSKYVDLLEEANLLKSILPICMDCSKIKNGRGKWIPIQDYFRTETLSEVSHGICDICLKERSAII